MDPHFSFDSGDVELQGPAAQSPWEFAGVTHSVAEEHAAYNTTSIDHKIKQQLDRRKVFAQRSSRDGVGLPNGNAGSDEEVSERSTGEESEDECDEMPVERMARAPNGRWKAADEQNEEGSPGEVAEASDDDEEYPDNGVAVAKRKPEKTRASKDKAEVKASGFFSPSEGAKFSAQSFSELNLSRPLLRACAALGYEQPTPIQAACVPLALAGRDICGSAMTGSGKTAAFALPVLERLLYRPRRVPATRVLILTPTRELAVQVHSMTEKLAQFTDTRACLVVGGLSSKVQETALRTGPDIVVATPGRMIDHLRNSRSVGLEDLAILVLDEADRLLEMGFKEELKELVRLCPRQRQTLLFSATMTEEVKELVDLSLHSPVRLSADARAQRPDTLVEEVVKLKDRQEADKEAILLALCTRTFHREVIIFSSTKHEAHRLKIIFGLAGLKAGELHGNLTQAMRLEALDAFRQKKVDFLIATDVAARGLDIIGVSTVINFSCPADLTRYVHRVGRTARAGRGGCAVTFVGEGERGLLKQLVKRAGSAFRSRQVAAAAVAKARQQIEAMEGDIRELQRQEREEKELRQAEMEASKAQNMLEHEAEIFARPARSWFQTPQERKAAAAIAKEAALGTKTDVNVKKLECLESASEKRKAEKLRKEREKRLPRKKRRRLEAEREAAMEAEGDTGTEDEVEEMEEADEPGEARKKGGGKAAANGKSNVKGSKSGKGGASLIDVAYRRAKAAKAVRRLKESGTFSTALKPGGGATVSKKKSRKREGSAPSGEPPEHPAMLASARKAKPKKAFKSKARYKRKK